MSRLSNPVPQRWSAWARALSAILLAFATLLPAAGLQAAPAEPCLSPSALYSNHFCCQPQTHAVQPVGTAAVSTHCHTTAAGMRPARQVLNAQASAVRTVTRLSVAAMPQERFQSPLRVQSRLKSEAATSIVCCHCYTPPTRFPALVPAARTGFIASLPASCEPLAATLSAAVPSLAPQAMSLPKPPLLSLRV